MLDRGRGKYMQHLVRNSVRESVSKKEQIDNGSLMNRFEQTIDPNVLKNLCENIIKKQTAKKSKNGKSKTFDLFLFLAGQMSERLSGYYYSAALATEVLNLALLLGASRAISYYRPLLS